MGTVSARRTFAAVTCLEPTCNEGAGRFQITKMTAGEVAGEQWSYTLPHMHHDISHTTMHAYLHI